MANPEEGGAKAQGGFLQFADASWRDPFLVEEALRREDSRVEFKWGVFCEVRGRGRARGEGREAASAAISAPSLRRRATSAPRACRRS